MRLTKNAVSAALASVAILSLLVGFSVPPAPPILYDADAKPITIAASTSGVAVTVNPSRPYALYHTGKSSAAAASTAIVAVGYDAVSTAADYTAESNKLILEAGGTVLIERGPATLYLKSASGAPIIQIVPKVRVR